MGAHKPHLRLAHAAFSQMFGAEVQADKVQNRVDSSSVSSTNTKPSPTLVPCPATTAKCLLPTPAPEPETPGDNSKNLESIKLIVNSDARYSVGLQMLFKSMEEANFTHWHDVIVVRASAPRIAIYKPNTAFGDCGVTYIDITWKHSEYVGFAVLSRELNNLDNTHVRADVYFYIDDTCIVDPNFPEQFELMRKVTKPRQLYYTGPDSFNIVVFGRGVVERYRRTYETFVPKQLRSMVDAGGCVWNVCHISHYAEPKTTIARHWKTSSKDPYGIGVESAGCHYDDFAVTKYFCNMDDGSHAENAFPFSDCEPATGIASTVSNSIKLIINADSRRPGALQTLFKSMEDANFTRWHDVVVVRAEASRNIICHPNTAYGKLGVTYIDIKSKSSQYYGLAVLHRERDNPLVNASVYFYIHDTCIVDNSFPWHFEYMSQVTQDHQLYYPGAYSSNICVFGRGVVETYQLTYDTFVPKRQSYLIEAGGCFENVCHISKYSNVTLIAPPIATRSKDPYSIGVDSIGCYYYDFGVTMYFYNFDIGLVGDALSISDCTGPSRTVDNDIKLIVNSDSKYSVALETLFRSMEDAGFMRWQDVVVVRASAAQSAIYRPNTSYGARGVTYVDITWMNYDYHGFAVLYEHRENVFVKARVYFYIHDTCTVGKQFPERFEYFREVTGEQQLFWPGPYSSNICVFGRGVVERYQRNFEKVVPKRESIVIESGNCYAGMCNIRYFADVTPIGEREGTGEIDVYHTGVTRTATYYKDFDVTKYFLYNREGDLTGNLHPFTL